MMIGAPCAPITIAGAVPNEEITAAAVVVAVEPEPVVMAAETVMPLATLPSTSTAGPPNSTWSLPSSFSSERTVGAVVDR